MIDIHTHILPCIDDGSPDMDTSLELIKAEIEQGVTDLFVTPHYYHLRGFISPVEENEKIFEKLKEEVKKQGLEINLYLGTEIYYDRKTLKNLENNIVKPLGDSKHVLVEFSLFKEIEDIPEAINNLTAKGYTPIIAHPERYPYIKKIESYFYMKRMGAKIQLNASSILGKYGGKTKKFVFKLIENNLVDFIASDMHNFRMDGLKDAYLVVEKAFSKEKADKLFNNASVFN